MSSFHFHHAVSLTVAAGMWLELFVRDARLGVMAMITDNEELGVWLHIGHRPQSSVTPDAHGLCTV